MATLGRWNRTITDAAGNVANATVYVYKESDGLIATIYSDRAGATPKSNPFTLSNSDMGLAFFHAAGGAYKVVAVSGSYSQTWRYEPVGTGAEFDSDSLSGVTPPTTTVPAGIHIAEATNNGSSYVNVTVPASLSASYTFTLPAADVTISSFIATLLDDADAATARSTIGAVAITGDTMTGALATTSSNSFAPQNVAENTANDAYSAYWIMRKKRGSATVQVGDLVGVLQYAGWDGSAYYSAAEVRATVESVSAGSVKARLDFYAGTNFLRLASDSTALLTPPGAIKLASYTVGTLPSAATVGAGSLAYVTDSNTTTFNATVGSGGSNKVAVISDGSNWKVH